MKNSDIALGATIWFIFVAQLNIANSNYNTYFISMMLSFLAYLIIRAIEKTKPND